MFDSALSRVARQLGIITSKCEYASHCDCFRNDSETCTKELDKTYCGMYNRFMEASNSE